MSEQNPKSLHAAEAAAFRTRLAHLAAAAAVEDGVFADIIYTAVARFGISEEKMRAAFGLSKDAVSRWTQMKNMPQPFVRPKIISWILTQIP